MRATAEAVAEIGIRAIEAVAVAKIDAKNAEIARLRQALDHIAGWSGGTEWPMDIARKALSSGTATHTQSGNS